MFGRVRDNYGKAPARLGYVVERFSDLGDDACYLIYNGKVEVRALRGETELAVSLPCHYHRQQRRRGWRSTSRRQR